jgi:hypothetical protein
MFKKTVLLAVWILFVSGYSFSQEIQARVTVVANKISTQVNKNIFQTLQSTITNFLNGRKWTNDVYQAGEKIQCNFLLSIESELGNNIYGAKLTVQAARPVYNSTYDSPIVNYIDNDVTFRYQEFQPFEFNENRVQGSDPAVANLPAIFAYYVNIILGLDYDSFSLRGGDEYFKKAWNIVNNAPESRDISGWKSFESLRNRYWLAENFNNNRLALIHNVIYNYYRAGMDVFYENEDEGRNGIINALNFLNTLNTENPNSMVLQFFFQGKSTELVKIFSRANPEMKTKAKEVLTKLDVTNASAYKEIR